MRIEGCNSDHILFDSQKVYSYQSCSCSCCKSSNKLGLSYFDLASNNDKPKPRLLTQEREREKHKRVALFIIDNILNRGMMMSLDFHDMMYSHALACVAATARARPFQQPKAVEIIN